MSDLRCFFGRHQMYRFARVGYGTFQVRCRRCERKWGMNESVRAILPWVDVAELYEGPDATFPESGWTYPRPVSDDADTLSVGISALAEMKPNNPTPNGGDQ